MKIKDLNKQGVFGVYSLEKTDNDYLFFFRSLSESYYAIQNGTIVSIPSKYSNDIEDKILELIAYCAPLFNIKTYKKTIRENYDEKSKICKIEKEILPSSSSGINTCDKEFVLNFLSKEGFNTSNLSNSNLGNSKFIRDYSTLCTTENAKKILDLNKMMLKNIKLTDPFHISIGELIKKGFSWLYFIIGPAGTGKSMLAHLLANYCEAPLLTIQASEGMEKAELIGQTTINPNFGMTGHPDCDKQYIFVPGPLLVAYSEGYQILIDEANYLLPGVTSAINQMVDGTPSYVVEGKRYFRNNNFVLYLSSNPGYEGTYNYNAATKSRGYTISLPQLTQEQFTERMVAYSKKMLSKNFFKELYSFGNYLQDISLSWSENSEVCLRHAEALTDSILISSCSEENFMKAVENSYLSNILAMDNCANMTKMFNLINTEPFKEQIKNIYKFYDYKASISISPSSDFFSNNEELDLTEEVNVSNNDINLDSAALMETLQSE